MSQTIRQSFDEYRRQFKINAASADRSLLESVKQGLSERLQAEVLDSEAVHLAADLSNYFGESREVTIQTLSRYLTQPLAADEESWARWKLVDNLAILQRCVEVVTTQRQFLDWAKRALAPDQLIWVMYDSTQALCWVEIGKADSWLRIFRSLMARTRATPENRRDRLIYLETASVVLTKINRANEVLQIADRVRELAKEDVSWDRSIEAQLTSFNIAANAYHAMREPQEIGRIAKTATHLLEEQWRNLSDADRAQKQKLLVMYHNMGGTLYLTRQYELAIPLLQRAVELHSFVEHTYLWLAASLWAVGEERSEVLDILQRGANRSVGNQGLGSLGYDKWTTLPEFQNVANDPEFLRAVKP